ncbi:MAG: branched-chain amino acid aminotransferase [Bdellovibrionales bacterium]
MNQITKMTKLPPVKYTPNPMFGTIFAPHVLKMELSLEGTNNFEAVIKPLEKEPHSPAMAALHYGQSIFEGMKAFVQKDKGIGVFRADLHARRFRKSARRMAMAEIPEEIFVNCVKEYVAFVADNVPHEPDHSLYLRPLLIAADEKIKVGTSQKYLFYIMSTIAGNYFGSSGKLKPARVMVDRQFVRATPGGMGEIKTAANYAASIWPQRIAAQKECDQVLYLDSVKHDFVDELGGMNFFAVRNNELLTPKLNGCILDGVTRRSIIETSAQLDLKSIETDISFTQLRKDILAGTITEAFACGTAAVVHPIGEFLFQDSPGSQPEMLKLKAEPNVSLKILEHIKAIQRGQKNAPGSWILKCT